MTPVFDRTRHRRMWRWVAQRLASATPEWADKRKWPGWKHLSPPPQHCFACMAVDGECSMCPLQWETVTGLPLGGCYTERAKDGRIPFTGSLSLFEFYQEGLAQIAAATDKGEKLHAANNVRQVALRIAELPLSETFAQLWREGRARII